MNTPLFRLRMSDEDRGKLDRIRVRLETELGRDVSMSDVLRWFLHLFDTGQRVWTDFLTDDEIASVPDTSPGRTNNR